MRTAEHDFNEKFRLQMMGGGIDEDSDEGDIQVKGNIDHKIQHELLLERRNVMMKMR